MKATYAGGYMFSSGKSFGECTPEERLAILDSYYEEGGIGYVSTFNDVLFNEEANEFVADYLREKMAARVKDPALREKLLPRGFPVGSRRPCIDSGYLETFDRENVDLVDLRATPVVRFTQRGIETSNGNHEFDRVIVALGFDAGTGAQLAIDPFNGKGGRLSQAWADGPRTYVGMAVAGFPNLFLMNSPGATSVFGNVPVVSEYEGDWTAECIGWLDANGLSTIEAEDDAQEAWTAELHQIGESSLLMKAPSWYSGGNIPGKTRGILGYLSGFDVYRARAKGAAADGYRGFRAA
jgi:cyclohexanone monooxygenase